MQIRIESARPTVPETPSEADLQPWRARIDAIDRAILHLMNERVRCANTIGSIKQRIGLPVYQPGREAEVLQNVVSANTGPLPDAAVRRLFERVIDETRSLERQQFQSNAADGTGWPLDLE